MTGGPDLRKGMQFTMPRRAFLGGTSALAVLAMSRPLRALAEVAAAPDLSGRDPKTLVVLVDATVANLDPATNIEWAYGLRPVYETLTVLDGLETLKVAPALATSWSAKLDVQAGRRCRLP